jgi:hypothetical protein
MDKVQKPSINEESYPNTHIVLYANIRQCSVLFRETYNVKVRHAVAQLVILQAGRSRERFLMA